MTPSDPEPREAIESAAIYNACLTVGAFALWNLSVYGHDYLGYFPMVVMLLSLGCLGVSLLVTAVIFFSRRGERATRWMWGSIGVALVMIGDFIWRLCWSR